LRSLRPSARILSVVSRGRATIVTEAIIHRRSRRSRRRDPEKPVSIRWVIRCDRWGVPWRARCLS
jgi:hypothetical protein